MQHTLVGKTKTGTFIKNKNYRKLSQKLTKIILFTTKIVINCSKLTKILLKRRIEPIKPIQIKNNETTITIYKLAN